VNSPVADVPTGAFRVGELAQKLVGSSGLASGRVHRKDSFIMARFISLRTSRQVGTFPSRAMMVVNVDQIVWAGEAPAGMSKILLSTGETLDVALSFVNLEAQLGVDGNRTVPGD
jgi:hypothetical protein